MGFGLTSIWFLAFLFCALTVYYVLPGRVQWCWLLLASIGFIYLATGVASFPFLIADIVVVYAAGRLISQTGKSAAKRAILCVAIFLVIAQLFLLKYLGNMSGWIGKLTDYVFGFRLPNYQLSWIAPIGISYFSLSAIGYLLDVYWGTYPAEKNLFKIALFISWFPALVSGPFVKYGEQRLHLFTPHKFSYINVKFGLERMLWGLVKKMVIADRIAIFTSTVFAYTTTYGGLYIVVAVILFAMQIYADFSGCMDIIIGASETFQIELPENFASPFFSQNLSEFWRRWHISLGVWAKEYIMYPLLKSAPFQSLGKLSKRLLGKKAGKNIPTYLGMLILWIIIGIWHGGSAKLIFAAGILPWLLIVCGQLLQGFFDGVVKTLRIKTDCFSYRLFSSIRTLLLMCIIWLFAMYSKGIFGGVQAIKSIITDFNPWILFDGSIYTPGLDYMDFAIIGLGFIALLVISILKKRNVSIREKLEEQNIPFQWAVLLSGIFAVLIFGIYGPGYNPADFIYAGF